MVKANSPFILNCTLWVGNMPSFLSDDKIVITRYQEVIGKEVLSE